MNAYIWKRVPHFTPERHPEAGIVAVARDYDHAAELIEAERKRLFCERYYDDEELAGSGYEPYGELPAFDMFYPIDSGHVEARVWVFPDAGCC